MSRYAYHLIERHGFTVDEEEEEGGGRTHLAQYFALFRG